MVSKTIAFLILILLFGCSDKQSELIESQKSQATEASKTDEQQRKEYEEAIQRIASDSKSAEEYWSSKSLSKEKNN